ncbi:YlbE-like family protein [Mycoplasmatota bacterium WC44]
MGLSHQILEKLYKDENAPILEYLRYNPKWYRILDRDPKKYEVFESEAKKYLKMTTYDKINSVKNQVDMLSMFIQYLNN